MQLIASVTVDGLSPPQYFNLTSMTYASTAPMRLVGHKLDGSVIEGDPTTGSVVATEVPDKWQGLWQLDFVAATPADASIGLSIGKLEAQLCTFKVGANETYGTPPLQETLRSIGVLPNGVRLSLRFWGPPNVRRCPSSRLLLLFLPFASEELPNDSLPVIFRRTCACEVSALSTTIRPPLPPPQHHQSLQMVACGRAEFYSNCWLLLVSNLAIFVYNVLHPLMFQFPTDRLLCFICYTWKFTAFPAPDIFAKTWYARVYGSTVCVCVVGGGARAIPGRKRRDKLTNCFGNCPGMRCA